MKNNISGTMDTLGFIRYKRICKKRFSLIELLVVVAIISILASLLLPALSKARDRVKQIACVNNQKQISYATSAYVQDFDGYFYMTYTQVGAEYWDNVLVEMKYLKNYTVFECLKRQELRNEADSNPSDFVPNYRVFKPLLSPGVLDFLKITEIKCPSNTVSVLDAQQEPLARRCSKSLFSFCSAVWKRLFSSPSLSISKKFL